MSPTVYDSVQTSLIKNSSLTFITCLPQVPLYLTLYPNNIPQIFALVQNSQKSPTPIPLIHKRVLYFCLHFYNDDSSFLSDRHTTLTPPLSVITIIVLT